MSIEFAIEYPCPLRARYAEEHLRAWGRLGNIHTRLTTGEVAAPSVEKLRFVVQSSHEIELMQSETSVCDVCPAHLPQAAAGEGESVGCQGRITYPIEAQFEKFLADRVQLALDTVAETEQPRLLRVLVDPDSPFDGEGAKALRRVTTPEGLRFYDLRLPIKFARAAASLTTDHLFDALAGFTAGDAGRTTYARELPSLAAPDYYDFLEFVLLYELSPEEQARRAARSRNYQQFLRLLAALERAEALQARVLLD